MQARISLIVTLQDLLPALAIVMLAGQNVLAADAATQPLRHERQTKLPRLGGIYSDLRRDTQEGDLTGTEIFIVDGGVSGYYAVLQCADGEPSRPTLVKATVQATRIELEAHHDQDSHCPASRFLGTLTQGRLKGRFEDTPYQVDLTRKRQFFANVKQL